MTSSNPVAVLANFYKFNATDKQLALLLAQNAVPVQELVVNVLALNIAKCSPECECRNPCEKREKHHEGCEPEPCKLLQVLIRVGIVGSDSAVTTQAMEMLLEANLKLLCLKFEVVVGIAVSHLVISSTEAPLLVVPALAETEFLTLAVCNDVHVRAMFLSVGSQDDSLTASTDVVVNILCNHRSKMVALLNAFDFGSPDLCVNSTNVSALVAKEHKRCKCCQLKKCNCKCGKKSRSPSPHRKPSSPCGCGK